MKKLFSAAIGLFLRHWPFFICVVLLVLLLARNPFSQRTLIPTLDPFPDSIHYTNSAFSLLAGKGFVLEREGGRVRADVPPLYSLTLIPFFVIFNDVRAFYFTNVVLALIAYGLFYRVVAKNFPDSRVQFLVLFAYLTFLPLTWYPTLVMAENLTLVLFLLGLNLMIDRYVLKKGLLMAVVCVSFYATKYASVPLLVSFSLLYLIKIGLSFSGKKLVATRYKNCGYFLFALWLLMGLFECAEYFIKGTTIITQLIPLFIEVFITHSPRTTVGGPQPESVFFSTAFIAHNLKSYLEWLIGGKLYILWKQTQILPPIWAIPAVLGLGVAVLKKQWQSLAITLLVTLVTVIGFMMNFYTTDGRYFYNAVPTLFLSLGFFLTLLVEFFQKRLSKWLTAIVLVGIGLALLIPNALPLKSAVMLNLRHAETPWPYISILRLNTFVKHQAEITQSSVTPVVISPLSPYYIDYFRTEPMLLLPLSLVQEHRAHPTQVWGEYDYQNLHVLYTDFLKKHVPVYFASYGIGNDKNLQAARDDLKKDFVVTEVDNGCLNVCNIYRLELLTSRQSVKDPN